MNIYQKLIEVRKAVPYLKKDEKGHGFKYVSSSKTLGNVRAKMDEVGLLLVPGVTKSTVSDHTTQKGNHEYFTELEMKYTWVNAEKPEETLSIPWYGQGLDTGEKGVGKALTYAEKYFLLKFFNIPTDKDDPDSFQSKTAPKKGAAEWEKEADKHKGSVAALESWYKKNAKEIGTLSTADQTKVIGYLGDLKALIIEQSIKCTETGNMSTEDQCINSKCPSTFAKCKGSKLTINV